MRHDQRRDERGDAGQHLHVGGPSVTKRTGAHFNLMPISARMSFNTTPMA